MCRPRQQSYEAQRAFQGKASPRYTFFVTYLPSGQKIGFRTKTDLISWWWDHFGFDFQLLNRTGFEGFMRLVETADGHVRLYYEPCPYLITDANEQPVDISSWDLKYKDILTEYRMTQIPSERPKRPHHKKGPSMYRRSCQNQATLQDYQPEYGHLLRHKARNTELRPWQYHAKAQQKAHTCSKCWKDQRTDRTQYRDLSSCSGVSEKKISEGDEDHDEIYPSGKTEQKSPEGL